MKKYIVLKKVITDEFVFVEAKDETQAKTLVLGGKGKYQGTQYAGELPASCWGVEQLKEENKLFGNNETRRPSNRDSRE